MEKQTSKTHYHIRIAVRDENSGKVAECFACAIDLNDEKFALNPVLMDTLRVLRGEKQADLDLTQELVSASVN